MKALFLIIFILSSILLAKEKHLILAEGNGWFPHMAENLIENHATISQLPFSGFVVVGNSFTDLVMKKNQTVTYKKVWQELKGLKNLYKRQRHNFLQINIHFPADFWNNKAWNRVAQNFAVVAQVSKDLGFKGIVFDDEPYTQSAKQMVNYKFPTLEEIKLKPNKYTTHQKQGAEPKWVDQHAYSNKKYSFQQHMNQVSLQFKKIMSAMTDAYPELVTLVYLGPSLSHSNSNKNYPVVIDMGLPRENEYHGAIFTGLKQGLQKEASLHDMGESYKYRKNADFGYAYQWRKKDIAKDKYNDTLNPNLHWVLPKSERLSWSNDVQVGFMVFNKGQKSSYDAFTTLDKSSVHDIEKTLYKALKFSDEYVIYYCEEQDWLLPNKKYPLPHSWMKMMHRVYKKLDAYTLDNN
ncbi:MAG: Unknown protein [uncultured Sulfurovum sp.]|uniref:Uncharacterized protein n=1 Tax=uncultured Sulfurovum sp. TaxID=269237 RepID=A0A6S6T530_9BACT|nr:MAG: Unknown protein [uncultured Sulfurovum sp.]